MTDLFNNPSNDYVYPALSPCSGKADDQFLEFVDGGIGIVKGSNILTKINFSDLSIPISSYSQQTKILGPGEVTYIPGLTKGLQKKSQGFKIPNILYNGSHNPELNPFFIKVDLSINYYKNFAFIQESIIAEGDYSQNIDIESALNLALGNAKVKALSKYDPSTLKITGTSDGWEFDVTNVILTTIPSSDPSVFDNEINYILNEDPSLSISASKYPNGAVQGIVMKGSYPGDSPVAPYDHWLYINHVTDYVTIYDPISIDNFIIDSSNYLNVSFDISTNLGIIKPDINPDPSLAQIDSSVLDSSIINNSYILDSSISNSTINNSYSEKNIFSGSIISDSSLYGNSVINEGSIISNSLLENIWTNTFRLLVNPSTGEYIYVQDDDTLGLDSSSNTVTISNSDIWDSSINNAILNDCSLYRTHLEDVSLNGCTIYNSILDPSLYQNGLDTNRIILIDPSIENSMELTYDASTFYTKQRKRLNVGLSGCSTIQEMAAGDYLKWVTDNDYWRKFSELYAWTTSAECNLCSYSKNLVDGFYVYNPHTFDVKIEYLIIV
jgi:uncharacterized protein YjbI with pentapeptide repeats